VNDVSKFKKVEIEYHWYENNSTREKKRILTNLTGYIWNHCLPSVL